MLKTVFRVGQCSGNIVRDNSSASESLVNRKIVKSYLSFNEIPGPRSYPLVGTLHTYLPFIGDYRAEALDKNALLNYRRYGPMVRESLMPGVQILHLFDPEDIELVFRQEDRLPARRSHLAMRYYRITKPTVYNSGGLIATNGPVWWRLRSTFQKNFSSPKSVKGHVESTDNIVREFVQWIQDNSFQDFLPYLNRLNLEVIGVVAFDERFHSFSSSEQEKKSRSSRIISSAFGSSSGIMKLDKGFIWKLFRTPLYSKLAKSQEYLEKVSSEILIKKAAFFENNNTNLTNNCLLSSFLRECDDLKDVMGMMVDILMASIDTTAYSTSFALYHLARNPECLQKLFAEVSTLLPNKEDVLTADMLTEAVYTRCCIKESLRLNPVAIGVGRVLQRDIVLRGYEIPKDTVIVTQNMTASRLPQYVKDPLRFKPERWLRDSEDHENIHPFLSLPFGFGPRSCIARRLAEQNMWITLIRLVREFDIKWDGGELGIKTHLINKPDQPVALSFATRCA